jgi:ATP phosphoribosyltransferase
MFSKQNIRLSLPSKGRLEEGALEFLSDAGLHVFKPNPRQYLADLPALPELKVIFQRPGHCCQRARGSIDFGITGLI